MIETLIEALRTEFGGEISFHPVLPKTISTAPAVVVAPGDPFIENGTHGTVTETWQVLVVVSMKEAGLGLDTMRELSLRVRQVVGAVGASWQQASGPQRLQREASQKQFVLSVNEVKFKYDPSTI